MKGNKGRVGVKSLGGVGVIGQRTDLAPIYTRRLIIE